ncbi:MAG TPA: diacylglycerol kinase family protein [Steroidobacteraceae bacterium]
MKWLAIANPAAGRAHEARHLLHQLRDCRDVQVQVAETRAPGDATRLARESSGFDGVIAIGGDGTVAEVLQGLDHSRQQLAVLPAGHGNCLARDLGLAEPGRALRALRGGVTRPLDLIDVLATHPGGRQSRRVCASTLALGYVTEVVMFGRQKLALLGRSAYAAAAMLVVPKPFRARLSGAADGGGLREYTGIVVNNTAHLANFRGFPQATTADGRLDVMELAHGWPRQLLHNAAVLAGSQRFGPLAMRQAVAEHVELQAPHTLMADGELLHDVHQVSATCLPAAVRCIVAVE